MQNSIDYNLLDNPIMRRESLTLHRQRGKWFWRIVFTLTALLILLPVLWGFGNHFYDSTIFTAVALVIANVVIYPMVVIRTINAATDSTYRERNGKTWDLLILTGVSNWRLVLGKWLGVMRFLKREYIWLFAVRIATLLWFNINFNLSQDYDYSQLHYYWSGTNNQLVNLFNIRIGSDYLLLMLVAVFIFTVLEMMMSSAIGLAFSFFKWNARTGTSVAIGVRIALAIALPIVIAIGIAYADGDFWNELSHDESLIFVAMRSSTILVDNGMVSTGMILDPYSEIMDEFPKEMIVSHLFGLALYAILTLLSLNLAANRALVQGGNPDVALMPQEKAKRKAKIQPTLETASTESQAEALNIAHGSGNIFELENAENLSVEVYHYQRRLGRMYLRITGENEPIYIMLSNVSYMETPSFWKGANFQTASQADYEAFIQAKQIHISTLAEDTMRLYQSADVKIIAGKAEILDELPVNI